MTRCKRAGGGFPNRVDCRRFCACWCGFGTCLFVRHCSCLSSAARVTPCAASQEEVSEFMEPWPAHLQWENNEGEDSQRHQEAADGTYLTGSGSVHAPYRSVSSSTVVCWVWRRGLRGWMW